LLLLIGACTSTLKDSGDAADALEAHQAKVKSIRRLICFLSTQIKFPPVRPGCMFRAYRNRCKRPLVPRANNNEVASLKIRLRGMVRFDEPVVAKSRLAMSYEFPARAGKIPGKAYR
jgi:hypothetical protein